MSKYDPLLRHLKRKLASEVEMSFDDIERLVGLLPKRALQPQWWANEATSDNEQVQCHAWLDARRTACLIVGKERVIFRRAARDALV